MEIFQFCVDDNFALEVQWIPRSEIDRADYISRFIDTTTAIVVPFWPSSYFWPIITRTFASSIEDYRWFNAKDALEHGWNTNSFLGSGGFIGLVLALRMKFSSPSHAFRFLVPPLSVSLAVSYLNKVYKSSNSYATLLLSHANLKRFHSFFPCNDNSPLNTVKRCKPVTVKKAPMPTDVIRSIMNKYAGPSANLEDLRYACICSIGLAGFFRYDELSNIAPAHLKFCPEYLRVFFLPRRRMILPGRKLCLCQEARLQFLSRGTFRK
ncbi:hypothetical protein pdam_00016337, partial [Pocillopora damicornis]